MKVSALLYAAGLGTRMEHLTADKPKPLIKVAGQPLIDHALDIVDHPAISDVTINTHYKSDLIKAHNYRREVTFSDERQLLETGGGLKQAAANFGSEIVLTLNSDAVWSGPDPAEPVLKSWGPEMDALLLLVPKEAAVGHKGKGDFSLSDDGLISRGRDYIYTGLQLIKSAPFVARNEDKFSTNLIWDDLIEKKSAYGVIYTGLWCDVGYPEAIELAEAMLSSAANV